MVRKTAITEVIASLAQVEARFGLRRTEDENFFPEWVENLPALTATEKSTLDRLRHRFLYHRQDGELTEGTVTLLVGSPLLEIAGIYDHPFKMRGEASVEIAIAHEDEPAEILRGRMDILVMQERLWIVILESKRTTISALTALPQTLTYMMANPDPNQPIFAMVTNGDEVFFVKVSPALLQYDVSDIFSPFPARNRLYTVVQVLKRIGAIVLQAN